MAREEITLMDSLSTAVVKMAEGNPGAARVLAELVKKDAFAVLDLDDMNIRGSQVWVAFKDFAGEDMEKLIVALRERDSKLVEVVNQECAHTGEIAVTGGASFKRAGVTK